MIFKLPELPFEADSLSPHISNETIDFHYNRHHRGYVNRLNDLIMKSTLQGKSLEHIISLSQIKNVDLFDNASQAWNHTFYWLGLSHRSSHPGGGELQEQIERDFGSVDLMKREFTEMAISLFGSGWVWLVKGRYGKLEIMCTTNADSPITDGKIPLLTCDLWEHAYYIDYRNVRLAYLEHFWKIANWRFANENFEREGLINLTDLMTTGRTSNNDSRNRIHAL